jgi:hypothetical protein
MKPALLLTLIAVSSCAVGCHNGKKLDNPQVYKAVASDLAEMRTRYQRRDPATRLGLVVASNPKVDVVAVGEINPADFHVGDIVSFVDTSETPLASGTVVRKLSDSIHVRYDSPLKGSRAPREGDVMIKFRQAT